MLSVQFQPGQLNNKRIRKQSNEKVQMSVYADTMTYAVTCIIEEPCTVHYKNSAQPKSQP